jgi:hypothetical protein
MADATFPHPEAPLHSCNVKSLCLNVIGRLITVENQPLFKSNIGQDTGFAPSAQITLGQVGTTLDPSSIGLDMSRPRLTGQAERAATPRLLISRGKSVFAPPS